MFLRIAGVRSTEQSGINSILVLVMNLWNGIQELYNSIKDYSQCYIVDLVSL